PTDEVPLLKVTSPREMVGTVAEDQCDRTGIVSMMRSDGEFLAVRAPMRFDEKGRVSIPGAHAEVLRVRAGDELGVTDMTDGFGQVPAARAAGAQAEKVL
ncbi:MAG: hypothetical protein ACF8LK_10290, partial [Phycisphaerales bacterium JB041]